MFDLVIYRALGQYYAVCNGEYVPQNQRVPPGGEVVFRISGPDPARLAREARKEAEQQGIQIQNLDKF